ncbi:MAG: CDP-alcohol phosphatidyltransferase family protein [Magnetococcales bacterium]|nr:CDP-alcohol phosphatidyltransferase family protein [Magnetococcales bacterium]
MNLPNALSFLRILAVPAFIWLVLEAHPQAALWLFAIAGITDALDGFIAKRFNMVTELGGYLDPMADKALLLAGFVTLSVMGQIPLWLVLIVVTRDLVIIGGAVVFQVVTGALRMEPLWISKVNTVMQMVLLCVVLLQGVRGGLEEVLLVLMLLTAGTTITSGWLYVVRWSRLAVLQEEKG